MSGIMRLGDMAWKQVQAYLGESDALIVPIGTCEQHGHHLPLSCDTRIAEAFAERVAQATGVPIAPTIPYGVNLPCDRFMSGTAGLSLASLEEALLDLLDDWVRHGFETFFIVTAHGCATDGYSFAHHEAIKQAALPLLEEEAARVFVLFPYWADYRDLLERQSSVEHAGEVETSLALHLFPELVNMELAKPPPAPAGEPRYRAFPEGVATSEPARGFSGAEGHPEAASAEKGRLIFERCLEPMVQFVQRTMRGEPK